MSMCSNQDSDGKVAEKIHFVPNLSSDEGDGLQLWMNALQSGKDVHCNLTTEDGYLTITLVDNSDKNKEEYEISEILPKKITTINTDALHNDDSQTDSFSSIEWGLFCNGDGDIVAQPVNGFANEEVNKQNLDEDENEDKYGDSNESCNVIREDSSLKHTVIVTVTPESIEAPEAKELVVSKFEAADPGMFPCIRNDWFKRHGHKPKKNCEGNYDDIDTIALATDLRNFLRHHNISITSFSKKYLNRSQGTVSDLLNHPKPWNNLSTRGKSLYIKMLEFLSTEKLFSLVDELSSNKSRRGPVVPKLPDYFMETLAKKMMPPTKMLLKIAQEHDLNLTYLKSFCAGQLKHAQDSVDVVVEFGDDEVTSDDEHETNEIEMTDESTQVDTVRLQSGFNPGAKDKHICPLIGCGCILSTRLTLKTHLLVHFGQKPHKCKFCDKSFTTFSNLQDHEARHENGFKQSKKAKKVAMLRKAAKNFVSVDNVGTGRKTLLKSKESVTRRRRESKKSTLACGVCSRSFSSKQLFQSHVANMHVSVVGHDHRQMYACVVCKKIFNTINAVIEHQENHRKSTSWCCRFCTKQFSNKYICERHELIHADPKPYECPRCAAVFSDVSALNVHTRMHTGERPYSCDICGKRFAQSGTLTSHRLTHTDELPFLCAICGKGFRQKTNLRSHQLRHSMEKNHKCETCKEVFVSKVDLQRHAGKHSKEHRFPCKKCSTSYSRLNYLNEHIRKVHNILPYKCGSCGSGFTTKATLTKHQPCKFETNADGKKRNKITKQDNDTNGNLSSVEMFPRTVRYVPSIHSKSAAEYDKNPQLAVARPAEVNPTFLQPDSATFPLNDDVNVPVAIVTDRGFVLTSSREMDQTFLEPNVAIANENLDLLSTIPTPQPRSTDDQNDSTPLCCPLSKEATFG